MTRERDEDIRYDDDVVRQLDDARDLSDACEPWFDKSAFMDCAAMLDAYIEGQQAGKRGSRAGENPWDIHTPHHDAWERGRQSSEAAYLVRYATQRRVA